MKVTRIYTDSEGHSHFEDVEVPLRESGAIGRLSEPYPVKSVVFRETDAEYSYDWHTAPRRQYIVLLDGEIEIGVSEGTKRRFRGGDVLLVEDTTGHGHKTRSVDRKLRHSLFVTLD